MSRIGGTVENNLKLILQRSIFLIFYQEKSKITPTKPSEVKRTRRERGEMENIIFKLFERQPNWALKQLVLETDQPEVCNYLFLTSVSCLSSSAFLGTIHHSIFFSFFPIAAIS